MNIKSIKQYIISLEPGDIIYIVDPSKSSYCTVKLNERQMNINPNGYSAFEFKPIASYQNDDYYLERTEYIVNDPKQGIPLTTRKLVESGVGMGYNYGYTYKESNVMFYVDEESAKNMVLQAAKDENEREQLLKIENTAKSIAQDAYNNVYKEVLESLNNEKD